MYFRSFPLPCHSPRLNYGTHQSHRKPLLGYHILVNAIFPLLVHNFDKAEVEGGKEAFGLSVLSNKRFSFARYRKAASMVGANFIYFSEGLVRLDQKRRVWLRFNKKSRAISLSGFTLLINLFSDRL